MESRALSALRCPVCGLPLTVGKTASPTVRCAVGHSFDVARQGYLNLLTGKGTKFSPDGAAMVAARDAFLDAGHYAPLARALHTAVANMLATRPPVKQGRPLLLDAGTGTGYYLQHILAGHCDQDTSETVGAHKPTWDAVGLDISKFALRRAARRNPQGVHAVWDLWQPFPIASDSVDVVLVIFAPRNAAEFARVLAPGGHLIVVTPGPGHLREIAAQVGMLGIQPEKTASLVAGLADHLELVATAELTVPLTLSRDAVRDVALMGPAGHHMAPDLLEATVTALPELSTATAEFRISTFRPVIAKGA